MANTFDPRSEQDNDVYVYDNPKSDLAGKLGSAAIAVTSLVSAFAFLAPSAPSTSGQGSNLSEPAAADPHTTQATAPESAAGEASAAPASQAPASNTAAAAVRPRFVATGHNAATKPHTQVVSNPATPSATPTATPSQTPSATPTVDPNASIGGVAAGNTSSATAAAGTGNTASGTTAGNTSSSTAASGTTGNTASGTNNGGGRNPHEDHGDH